MDRYASVSDLRSRAPRLRKWDRVAQAISAASSHQEGVMYSLGDSLTYLRTRRRYDVELFTGHRRYQEVVAAGDCCVDVAISSCEALTPIGDYSDLSDREHFSGTGQAVRLEPGEIMVLAIDEAIRYPRICKGPMTVLHVTVEGAAFPNK